MNFVFTKKFSDTYWKLLHWIIYISLMAISFWFTWGVIDKFAKQETAIRQYEGQIEAHPTMVICGFSLLEEYQEYFSIGYMTYQSDGLSVENEVVLKMGENYLENSGEIVNLTNIHTRFNYRCFAINTNRNVDKRDTEIKILFLEPTLQTFFIQIHIFFTSEKNSFGVTRREWRDGEVYSSIISAGVKRNITFTVEKYINLKCNEESFYEHVTSRLSKQSFDKCNDTCLMTSLPNDLFPICTNVNEWYDKKGDTQERESDCNWRIVHNLIKNVTNNKKHQKTCIRTQYSGVYHEILEGETGIRYSFTLPLKAKVYEEYFIIDSIQLIGSVGGTLGMFIGFSFSNLIICIIEYIQSFMKRKLPSRKIFTNTIWKCFKWIIYLSLMGTAIFFAWDVIEKYFGQNKGIKRYTEKIESHPTITICPFLQSSYEGN